MSNNSSSSTGMGLPGFVFLVFLIMKLAGIGSVAHWSWWWVTSPLWIGYGLALIFILIALLIQAASKTDRY
jgi:hypothetical protein